MASLILAAALVLGGPPQNQKAGTAGQDTERRHSEAQSPSSEAGPEPKEPANWDSVVGSVPIDNPHAIVSLTFDDAFAGQYKAAEILSRYGIEGTFFAPSGNIGRDGYLSLDQLRTIEANGHEIGGHTVNHSDLVQGPVKEAMREVCLDRRNLAEWGFTVTSFAYPFASSTPDIRKVPEACGYNSARGLGDLATENACIGCPGAESLPPSDPYLIKAPEMVTTAWTLEDLRQVVRQAEETGGWTQLTFHHICDSGCSELAVTPELLEQFVAWLAARPAVGTATRTVHEVIGGAVQPLVRAPMDPAPPRGINEVRNHDLETPGGDHPRCWRPFQWGEVKPQFQTVSPGHSGNSALRVTVEDGTSGAARFMPALDLGHCAPTVIPGHSYSLRAWYTSTEKTQFAVYYRNELGSWNYWTSSPFFESSGKYRQATWTTPPVPEGTTGLSFGLNLTAPGQLTTDDYGLFDERDALPSAGSGTP
ncbi:polysaccharide deacetylase family protein [Arthrobacter pigmenti]